MNYSIRWVKLHSKIFSDYTILLNKYNVKYFILRNYEGLPELNISKDIDIIIEPGSFSKAYKYLEEVLVKHQIENIHLVKYERAHCCYATSINENFSLHIDLIEGYLSRGFEVFTFSNLYKHTIAYKNFRVLSPDFDAVILLFYKVVGTNSLEEKYQDKISSIYQNNAVSMNMIFKSVLGGRISNSITNALKRNDYKFILANSNKISRTSKLRVLLKNPVRTIWRVFSFLIEKFYRIVICPRRFQNFIAVLGADGTGKSTFIDGLTEAIAFYYNSDISKSHIYHHRPTLLPNLGAAGEKVGVMREDKNFTDPHRAKPVGLVSSIIRMSYYWLDYFIGVPLKLRKDVQFDRFTIYDRYIYDFLIDPLRSRIKLPYWLRKIFTKMTLQPRLVFILIAQAETIYERKQELSLEEIRRQLIELQRLAESHNRFIIIDASKKPEEMVHEAMKTIMERFTNRIS